MFKPPSRAVGGSTQVKAEKFGDHITADFIVTRDDLGIDGREKCTRSERHSHRFYIYIYMSTPMQEEPPMLPFWQSSILLDMMVRLVSSTVITRQS